MADSTITGATLMDFVGRQKPAEPSLPLTHIMDSYTLEGQYGTAELKMEDCDVFQEPLIYIFYGRPAFRPNMDKNPTSDDLHEPVCFILKPDLFHNVDRVYAFDTGAHHLDLYQPYLHKKMNRDDFQLVPPDVLSAKKSVTAFFETNENYLLSKPKVKNTRSKLNKLCGAYIKLIQNIGEAKTDDRCSAIELQFKRNINIEKSVLAVVAPKREAELMRNQISNIPWLGVNVDILHYRSIGRSNPSELYGAMRERALEWLENAGHLS